MNFIKIESMEDLWISKPIMALKRSTSERVLLSIICRQAALNGGSCNDSNKELALAMGAHLQTISGLVNRLSEAGLLRATTEGSLANKRTLVPLESLLSDYESITHRQEAGLNSGQSGYEPKTHSRVKRNIRPDRQPRFCPITGIDITRQRPNASFATVTTIRALFAGNRDRFDQLIEKFLKPDQLEKSMLERCFLLNKAVRRLGKGK